MSKKSSYLLITLVVLTTMGCATSRNERYAQLDNYVRAGDYNAALAIYEDKNELSELYNANKDLVLYHLDRGMIAYYANKYDLSISELEMGERLIEEYFTKSVSQAAASYLLNDNVIEYQGEVHEDLYVNLFKSLSYLEERDFDGAYVEVHRLTDKLNYLNDKYASLAQEYNSSEDEEIPITLEEIRFHNSALARYLSMLIYRGDNNWDSARIDRDQIKMAFASQSQIYDFPQPDLEPYLSNTDKGRLDFIGFAGQAPVKKANTLYIKTIKDQIIILLQEEGDDGQIHNKEVDSFYWNGMNSGYFFKFQLPYMKKQGSSVDRIRVKVDGEYAGDLELTESMENVAFETFKLKEPIIYIKTITRTIVKGLIAEEAKKVAKDQAQKQIDGFAGLLTGIVAEVAADIAVDASEKADLRSGRYFPSHAYTGEIWLDPGTHNIQVEYWSKDTLVSEKSYPEYNVSSNGLNLITTYTPE
ncbi:hypothetical protein [Spirochaeta cellobiosiphila]|uniref:hypothetical protein n=1 Tax=Spirochaeta cellobiosiphila TaxID=504483 RepID=UPI00048BA401|nr:hypothetical protein [Spirochaeta cellobiosiphila]